MDSVAIKGTRRGLAIVLKPGAAFEEIRSGLLEKIERKKEFFRGARYYLWTTEALTPAETAELDEICQRYGLVRADTEIQTSPRTGQTPTVTVPTSTAAQSRTPLQQASSTESKPQLAHLVPVRGIGPDEEKDKCAMVCRHVRSGDYIEHPHHIVVLGDVHPGAEIRAGGSVVVMGKIEGTVRAGQQNPLRSFVLALGFGRAQVWIGKFVLHLETDREEDRPLIARLAGRRITVTPYNPPA